MIRYFSLTIMYLMVVICQTIIFTIVRYRNLREDKAYSHYADSAILIAAAKAEANMQFTIGKHIIPITILIDIILLCLK